MQKKQKEKTFTRRSVFASRPLYFETALRWIALALWLEHPVHKRVRTSPSQSSIQGKESVQVRNVLAIIIWSVSGTALSKEIDQRFWLHNQSALGGDGTNKKNILEFHPKFQRLLASGTPHFVMIESLMGRTNIKLKVGFNE